MNEGSLGVVVTESDTFTVTVQIDSNLLDRVHTTVVDHTLRIELEGPVEDILPGPHVRVRMPHLVAATQTGSGDLDAATFDETTEIELQLAGAGQLTFEGSAPRVTAILDGNGQLRATGTTDEVVLSQNGSGNLDAQNLVARDADVRLDGSGVLEVHATGSAVVALSGGGVIDVWGNAPNHQFTSSSGIRFH